MAKFIYDPELDYDLPDDDPVAALSPEERAAYEDYMDNLPQWTPTNEEMIDMAQYFGADTDGVPS